MASKNFWRAAGVRALRSFLGAILAVWTGGLITQVDWKTTLLTAASAAIYSVLMAVFTGLPESKSRAAIETTEDEVTAYELEQEDKGAEEEAKK